MRRRHRLAAVATLSLAVTLPVRASAFDSIGHDVIEALAYRTLLEGHGRQPARPEVLRDLINEGALMPPVCFGRQDAEECRKAPVSNPLLEWPIPRTSWPDLNYRRQFSAEGQCFHFMAKASDEGSAPLAGTHIPRDLAVRAPVRCLDLLDRLLDTVVAVDGRNARESGLGLYELMHSVQDSFSHAHVQRQVGTGKIEFLRVWEPVGMLAGGRIGAAYSLSPTRHAAKDPRDRAYVRNFAEVEGRPCRDLVDFPYAVPFECLSEDGDAARQATVDLLVTLHDLRKARLAPTDASIRPSDSATWQAYKARWFDRVYACSGAECEEKQPAVRKSSSNVLVGIEGSFNPTAQTYGASLRGVLVQYSPELNPFVYTIGGQLGYRRAYAENNHFAAVGVTLDVLLPFGEAAAAGLSPGQVGVTTASSAGGAEILSQLGVLYWRPASNFWLEARGPLQFDWRRAQLDAFFALTIGLTPSLREVSPMQLIQRDERRAERHDDTWAPEPLWYGRLKGRVLSLYAELASSAYVPPAASAPGTLYGLGELGASVFWDRDRWGGRYLSAWGAGLYVGDRHTSGPAKYVTVAASFEWRWYVLTIAGLSLVPVRVEYGPRVAGGDYDDPSADVHGTPPGQYYLQAGSRLGIAFNAGLVDLLVQAPTLAWHSNPFEAQEIVTFQMGVKLR